MNSRRSSIDHSLPALLTNVGLSTTVFISLLYVYHVYFQCLIYTREMAGFGRLEPYASIRLYSSTELYELLLYAIYLPEQSINLLGYIRGL